MECGGRPRVRSLDSGQEGAGLGGLCGWYSCARCSGQEEGTSRKVEGEWPRCLQQEGNSEVMAGRSQWSPEPHPVQGSRRLEAEERGETSALPPPSHSGPSKLALGASPCWMNRVLALSQSHRQREKESGPRRDRFIKTPRLWLTSMSGLLCGGPCLAEPSTLDQRKEPGSQPPQSKTGYRLYWKQKG